MKSVLGNTSAIKALYHLHKISLAKTGIGLAFLFQAWYLSAQETPVKERAIGIGLGAQTFLINDEIGSNLNYSGSAFSTHVFFDVQKEKRATNLNVYFSSPNLTNNFNNNVLDGVFGLIDYHYLFRLSGTSLYIGPYVKMGGYIRTFEYRTNGISVDSGDAFLSLGISASFIKTILQGHQIRISGSFPILSYVTNREFNGSTTEELNSLNRLLDYNFKLQYDAPSKGSLQFFAAYSFWFFNLDRTTRVKYGSNLFETGLKFRFNQ